jgi:hypothetical protein
MVNSRPVGLLFVTDLNHCFWGTYVCRARRRFMRRT